MTAGALDLECYKGATFYHTIQILNPDETPARVAAWTPTLQIRRRVISEDPLLECSSENGKLIVQEDGYSLLLRLTATDTQSLPAGRHVYNLELSQIGNSVVTEDGEFSTDTRNNIIVRILKGFFDVRE